MSGNRFLVVVRAGDHSRHREWLQPAEHKNFDLYLICDGDEPGRYRDDCDRYHEGKGSKFQSISELIEACGETIWGYDAVWFPDDDIGTDARNIGLMFQRFMAYGLALAQPSLTKNAYFRVTARHIDYKLRYTHFVEPRAPIFSRDALRICWPTFNKHLTGWGLAFLWAKILGYPHKKMGVIDETPVKPRSAAGFGMLHANVPPQSGGNAEKNEMEIWDEYGLAAAKPDSISFYDGIKRWDPFSKRPGNAIRRRKKRTATLRARPSLKRGRGRKTYPAKRKPRKKTFPASIRKPSRSRLRKTM